MSVFCLDGHFRDPGRPLSFDGADSEEDSPQAGGDLRT